MSIKSFAIVIALCVSAILPAGSLSAQTAVHKDFELDAGCRHTVDLASCVRSRAMEMCVAVNGNRNSNGIGDASWGLTWSDREGRPVCIITVKWGNECLGDPLDRRFMLVSVDSIALDGVHVPILEQRLFDGVSLYGGYNTLSIDEVDGMMRMWVGNDYGKYVGECKAPDGAVAMSLEGSRRLKVRYIACSSEPDRASALASRWQPEELSAYLSSNVTAIEGEWEFLDRDTNAKWAQPGGLYQLAVVRYDPSRGGDLWHGLALFEGKQPAYEIIYLSGARVNAGKWKPGMVKGFLMPTIFENHFDLVWFDSYMEPMAEELWVDIVPGSILSLNFPLLHSQLRFSKKVVR